MFKSARIKLTAWYLLIIMCITIPFSTVIFISINRNTLSALESQRRRIEKQIIDINGRIILMPKSYVPYDIEALIEIRNKTFWNLVVINIVIFLMSGSLGYMLAGQTLKPIEQMVKKQKRFVSDAAHEMKTPLTAMKTGLEVTLRDKNLTAVEAKQAIKSTIEEVDKLSKFTGRLLNQSKYQIVGEQKFENVDIAAILTLVITKLQPLAQEKKEVITSKLETVKVKGNPDQLEELFTNLIENAIKYNKHGMPVNISAISQRPYAIVSIEDFGYGIAQEDLAHIFDPFYRADKSRTNSINEGYGLGLAISKEIVQNHNGKIAVTSKEGEGSKFFVKLPLSNNSVMPASLKR